MKLLIKPLTEKGKTAIETHLKNTKIKDMVIMRSMGIKQKKENYGLSIIVNNFATRLMEKHDPNKLKNYLLSEQSKLTDSIDKLGVTRGIDYEVIIENEKP